MPPTLTAQPPVASDARRLVRGLVGLVGLVALALAIVAAFFNPADFFRAYLFAVLACLGPALGCLLLIFIHRMTGGTWGRTLAPALDAGARMVPWTFLFSVPLLFGLRHLFPWAAPDALSEQTRAVLAKHAAYFNHTAFIVRAVCYASLGYVLLRMSRQRRSAWTGPVGMMLYVVTAYLLGVDWVMSIEPGWYSTAFPVIFMASHALAAFAFCTAVTILRGPEADPASSDTAVWKDLGNLLLGALMFWAYVAYSQFLIVWSGNLPDQAAWYLHRNAGGWHYLLIGLAILQLLIPVLLLLSNRVKRRTKLFAALACVVLACQTVYLYWLILPTYRPHGIDFHPLDALLPLALDALWLYVFLGLKPTSNLAEAPVDA